MNTETKYSIWQAHDRRCAYSGQLIENYNDLEIDHVIPISEKKEIIEQKKNDYTLDPTFDVKTSLENLLPCCRRFNRVKGRRPFTESTERFFIDQARKKKVDVERERTKFKARELQFEEEALKQSLRENVSSPFLGQL